MSMNMGKDLESVQKSLIYFLTWFVAQINCDYKLIEELPGNQFVSKSISFEDILLEVWKETQNIKKQMVP